ncbi:hypothetical protein SAMN05216464_11129 [Mucilaginibacter pineti]|uniref:Uncharacterized protein n=1 Tax=Mucilaginibacter pineti TaxID=1391627 RepID=A0A1G7H2P7_9SPHI|nr:hypothetical protein SAMN05216464_11129 [Mucilaginibacter pineti]
MNVLYYIFAKIIKGEITVENALRSVAPGGAG